MRYRLAAKIDGDIYLDSPVSIEREELLFEFYSDKSGRAVEVAVSTQVPQDIIRQFASIVEVSHDGSGARVVVGGEVELHQRLKAELQGLESNLAFASLGALRKIRWENPRQEFIPESSEEKELVAVSSFSRQREYPQISTSMTAQGLEHVVATAPKYDELKVLKAFWRDGLNFFRDFRYIQAFYSFYFVIEGLYAKGKSGKRSVLQEFQRSAEFGQVLENSLQALFEWPKHRGNLERLFRKEKCEISVRGLQELLFEIRGNLHHYSMASPKTRGTPFNQKEFESIALLTMHIVTSAIDHRVAAINQQAEVR